MNINSIFEIVRQSSIDPKYLGIPNINFSLTDKDDDREMKFAAQRIEMGFDESETWSLYNTISSFILPRLIRFREIRGSYPCGMTNQEWDNIISKMIKSFQNISIRDDDVEEKLTEETEEGLDLFREYFFCLWW